MRTAWVLTCFGVALLLLSLVILWSIGSDSKAIDSQIIALIAVAGTALLLLLWFVPKLQVRHLGTVDSAGQFNSENEARKSLAQIFGGIAFLATFYVSWANYNIEADKAVTETFGKAVEQLSNSDTSVRIGGAYILERLAKSSPKDYDAIISILTHSVQDHSRNGKYVRAVTWREGEAPRAPGDVETIMRIIGRREKLSTSTENALNLEDSDISEVRGKNLNLQWAYLVGSRMQAVYMYGVHLESAQLVRADASVVRIPKSSSLAAANQVDHCLDPDFVTHELVAATFSCGHFNKAILVDGNFEEASFNGADLTGAKLNGGNFQRAHFDKANLSQTDLSGADFRGADLSTAIGITEDQWRSATTDECTHKPRFDANASSWTAVGCGSQ